MEMHFRSFLGFERLKSLEYMLYDASERSYTSDDLGKMIVYSDKKKLNAHCLLGGDKYSEAPLLEQDWRSSFRIWAEYMRECNDIGCMTFTDSATHMNAILTERADINAYNGLDDYSSFYIIFNARPTRICMSNSEDVVTVGYDKYSFVRDRKSIIVWNLDDFDDIDLDDYTLWGIRHGTEHGYSVTDDEMVGIKDGRELYAIQ